ncbi:uncharacterized protein LOC6561585 [Drosophila grimshawi]|uniref:uncharacterized protein LOC6561585 n=1 Tax=Drosophila grimshawi TaxID=7222 RepID=UPI000C86E53E|nr:uncharacterized protein LOC6561585 [Drosophila grimshawi]
MGHQLSKQSVVVASSKSKSKENNKNQANLEQEQEQEQQLPATRISLQGLTPTAEEEEQEEEEVEASSAEVRQIIIKIQLAKMENGNAGNGNGRSVEQEQQQQQQPQQQLPLATGGVAMSADTLNANDQIVNVEMLTLAVATGAGSSGAIRTAGSLTEAPETNERRQQQQQLVNNNFAESVVSASTAVKMLQLYEDGNADADADADANDDDESEMEATMLSSLLRRRRPSTSSSSISANGAEGVDYCEVLEPQPPVNEMLSSGAQQRAQAPSSSGNSCCRSRSSKTLPAQGAAAGGGAEAGAAASTTKRRCCKCKCRDALRGLRGMLESSKDKKDTQAATAAAAAAAATATLSTSSRSKTRHIAADRRSTPPTLSVAAAAEHRRRQRNSVAVAEVSQVAIWASPVIIRISSTQPQQQLVVEAATAAVATNCGFTSTTTTPLVTVGGHNIRVVDAANMLPPREQSSSENASASAGVAMTPYGAGMRVHSQIDFMHCLVPDLERIFNSSFYWGKMDRYEAERLLEGKPEGTFLLRDSAQEDFLFSVTFRKYGRTLHARIEQSGHKFSFDCHDPCVFAALTVTGLLEHYKDPSCVMFFEPCLTMPLHRRQTFSLQQLARATIVSNTTYDGVSQMELPDRLKSYLKEYHYKQKLRVVDVVPPMPPPPAGFAYYEEADDDVDLDDDDDDDDDAVNIRVSYVQHAAVVAQFRQCGTSTTAATATAASRRHQPLQQQLFQLPNRMAAAFGRMSANLNCYQPVTAAAASRSSCNKRAA